MRAQTFDAPKVPLAPMAAMPVTNSVSPRDASSRGPVLRYIEWHSSNTVAITLWPL